MAIQTLWAYCTSDYFAIINVINAWVSNEIITSHTILAWIRNLNGTVWNFWNLWTLAWWSNLITISTFRTKYSCDFNTIWNYNNTNVILKSVSCSTVIACKVWLNFTIQDCRNDCTIMIWSNIIPMITL